MAPGSCLVPQGSWLKAHGSWPRIFLRRVPQSPGPRTKCFLERWALSHETWGHEPWALNLELWAVHHQPFMIDWSIDWLVNYYLVPSKYKSCPTKISWKIWSLTEAMMYKVSKISASCFLEDIDCSWKLAKNSLDDSRSSSEPVLSILRICQFEWSNYSMFRTFMVQKCIFRNDYVCQNVIL